MHGTAVLANPFSYYETLSTFWAAGKVPLYEYRVLTVDLGGIKHKGLDERPDGYDSGRNSPRQHLRRGHVRVCHSGTRVWVQPCVVGGGAHGVIDKDYAIGF